MSTALPEPIAAYFAATNKHDIDAMLAPFAEAATVKDEARERRGRSAIHEWIEETTRKYWHTVTVTNFTDTKDKILVTGQVSGNFPGSPVQLSYAFTLTNDQISRLEIE